MRVKSIRIRGVSRPENGWENKVTSDLFGCDKLSLPDLIRAADVMMDVTDIINAKIDSEYADKPRKGEILVGAVRRDVHDK